MPLLKRELKCKGVKYIIPKFCARFGSSMARPFTDGFDEFWAAYPRKVGKKDAQKAWDQLKPSADVQKDILDALTWQRQQPAWVKDEGQFVPYPATWLRGERWTDEPFQAPQISERHAKSLKAIYGDD